MRLRLLAIAFTLLALSGLGVASASNASAATASSVKNNTPVSIWVRSTNGSVITLGSTGRALPAAGFTVPGGICGRWYYTATPRSTYPIYGGVYKAIAQGYQVNVDGYRC